MKSKIPLCSWLSQTTLETILLIWFCLKKMTWKTSIMHRSNLTISWKWRMRALKNRSKSSQRWALLKLDLIVIKIQTTQARISILLLINQASTTHPKMKDSYSKGSQPLKMRSWVTNRMNNHWRSSLRNRIKAWKILW